MRQQNPGTPEPGTDADPDARSSSDASTSAEILAWLSHEIRTHVTDVLGVSGELLATSLHPTQRQSVGTIQSRGEAMLGLANDLLELSRIEAAPGAAREVDFGLAQVVEEALAAVTSDACQKAVALSWAADSDVPGRVRGDPDRLRQALVSILRGAARLAEGGTLPLRVSTGGAGDSAVDDDRPVCLRFTIRASGARLGAGLLDAGAQAERGRGSDLTARALGWTSILPARLAELMGGHLSVESRAGRRIEVILAARFAPPAGDQAITEPDLNRQRSLRALVVDDSSVNRMIATRALEKYGVTVATAANGAEAVRCVLEAAHDPFGLILMDLYMPELDGLGATRQIRGIEANRGWRAVIALVTPDCTDEDRARCAEAGMDTFLPKPIRPEKLQALVERAQDPSAEVDPLE